MLTNQQYQKKYATLDRFEMLFGHTNGPLMWYRYRQCMTIEKFRQQYPEADKRIAQDIRTLSMRNQ